MLPPCPQDPIAVLIRELARGPITFLLLTGTQQPNDLMQTPRAACSALSTRISFLYFLFIISPRLLSFLLAPSHCRGRL